MMTMLLVLISVERCRR